MRQNEKQIEGDPNQISIKVYLIGKQFNSHYPEQHHGHVTTHKAFLYLIPLVVCTIPRRVWNRSIFSYTGRFRVTF